MHRQHPTPPFLALAGVVLLATACATTEPPPPATELPPQAVTGLLDIRNRLIDNKAQLQKTTSAARDMVDHPRQDVQGQISTFSSALAKLNTDTLQTREAGAAVRGRAEDYFADWEKQLRTLSGQLGAAGQQRRQESLASFGRLQEQVTALRTQFAPFMSDMQATERFLQADPTASGVKAATPTLRSALAREPEVLKKVDELIAQIDVVRGGR
jgi:hypothetical protein